MARHAQPREVAKLKGAVHKNPQRYENEPPESGYPLGDPPESMSEDAKSVWFEISTYAPQNILSGSDRLVLEIASNLVAEYRKDVEGFAVGKYSHLISCLARLGMSVADRQKLNVGKPKEGAYSSFT